MKTLETAKAEAESIATRWVPAHMTARQGMVDDIAAALLGAAVVGYETHNSDLRRLVEEAQGERNRAYLTTAEYLAAKNNAVAERDRLKGELSEAKRRANDATAMVRDACSAHSDGCRCEWCAFVFPAAPATPAEQAQPTSKDDDQCARCPWPRKHHVPTGKFPCEGFIEAAEQAQGEGANFWAGPICTKTHAIGAACDCDPIAALAKRIDALTTHMEVLDLRVGRMEIAAEADAKSWAETALTLMNRVTKLEARIDRIASPPSRPFVSENKPGIVEDRDWQRDISEQVNKHEHRLRDLEWRFKAPPPEAAGPGHAFECRSPEKVVCNCLCLSCNKRKLDPIHAVPPIAGGAKP
jgi:hypothetical protein